MRDKIKSEYHGKGVKQAIANVNGPIAGALVGNDLEIANQEKMDKILLDLDGTKNKEICTYKAEGHSSKGTGGLLISKGSHTQKNFCGWKIK